MSAANQMIELRTGSESDRIALRGVRLQATLAGMAMRVTVEQTFVNLESKAIEAVYTFPLPETAAVCGFEVQTGDHVLTAQIEETDEAIRCYDDAVAAGNGAYMLEQDRPDVFAARVGNLKPGQAAKVRISYVAPLERVDRTLRVRFPTTIAPRYVSAAGSDDALLAAIDADALNPPHVLAVPYGLEMQIQVQLGGEVRAISSPTHLIRVERDAAKNDNWSVSFAGNQAQMDRDVVLNVELACETTPQIQVSPGPDKAHYLAITLVPEFDQETLGEHRPNETLFLLDCSGSMQGQSIRQATAALELCLRSLSAGDVFNICRFGSTFELLSPEPQTYSEETLHRALKFIRCSADLGGTEIYTPLSKLLATKPACGELRNVIVLTDGQVSNEPAVIELARKWEGTNRLFTFGIGAAASGYLVRNLASATGGAAEFISGDERIEEKVLRTFSRIDSPQITNVSVDWHGAEVQMPARIPPIFDGDLLRIFGRATGPLPDMVTLNCQTSAGPRSWSLTVPQAAEAGGVVALCWAQATIRSLEDAAGPIGPRQAKRASSAERRIVSLSRQFGILSSWTAFVAVEHRSVEDRNAGMPELRRIPVQLAAGWGGVGPLYGSTVTLATPFPSGASASCGPDVRARKVLRRASPRGFAERLATGSEDAALSLEAPEPPTAASGDPLFRLLALQSADGWFGEGYRDILASAGIDFSPWTARVERLKERLGADDSATNERVLATLLVLAVLNHSFADRKVSWRRADAKARRWCIRSAGLQNAEIDELLQTKQEPAPNPRP